MKKFLTVLLVIAVMFTFSFSSAFAMTADTVSEGYFANHWKTLTTTGTNYTVDDQTFDLAVLATVEAEAKAVYDAYVAAATEGSYLTNYDTFKTYLTSTTNATVGKKAEAFLLALAKAQLAADKADALAAFDTVATYNYSTAVMSKGDAEDLQILPDLKFVGKDYTYQQAAEKLVAYYKEAIEDLDDFDADVTYDEYNVARASMTSIVDDNLLPLGYKTGATTYALTQQYDFGFAYADTCKVYVSADTVTYTNLPSATNLYSDAVIAGAKAVEAATVASLKAANQAAYVTYTNANPSKKADADKWLKVANILAEDGQAAVTPVEASLTDYVDYAKKIAALEADAALYKTYKNADGTLKYDAAQIDKNLAAASLQVAEGVANYASKTDLVLGANPAADASLMSETMEKINYALDNFVADNTAAETYYAKELADVQKYVDACKAEVAAAADADEMKTIYLGYKAKIERVAKADDQTFAGEGYNTLKTAALAYLTYVNSGITVVKDQLVASDTNGEYLADGLVKLIGESGLRTQTEIKTLKDQVGAVVNALPTVNIREAALAAAKTAISAIPAKATVADAATVQAAVDAVKAAAKVTTTTSLNNTAVSNAVGQIAAEYNLDFAKKYATVAKTDKAAVKALKAEIKGVLNGTLKSLKAATEQKAYLNGLVDKLDEALTDIKDTEKKAVEAAIAALPYTASQEDVAAVKAARALYDAFAEEYKDITGLYNAATMALKDTDTSASLGIDTTKLEGLETLLGLNAEPEYAAVEALKLTAKSVAKKGYIKVSWTVKGDAAKADGYQVYRSTKANKGFKKAFTTTKTTYKNTKVTKGTRYFYKVRAYKTVDGVKYYSDWSNKAYRVAK